MEDSGQSAERIDDDHFRRLIDVGSSLLSELDLEAVLKSVVEAARELTGARYAAVGVLDPNGANSNASSTSASTRRRSGTSATSRAGGASSASSGG